VGGAWLVLRRGDTVVTQVRGPVLELMTASRARFDQRIAALGPDIVAEDFDEQRFLRRLRADDPTRGIGDALLDQQTLAGIGNFWKSEGCFAAGIDPWRPTGRVSDEEALAIVAAVRPGMQLAARDGNQTHHAHIYRRAERPCPRCGGRVRSRVLVRKMSAMRRIGHKGAAHIAPGNTLASFDAALAHGVDMIEFDVLRHEGRLVLAHDPEHAGPDAPTLEEGLAHLASAGIELDVDLKVPGYEAEVVEALRAFRLVDRALVSTMYMRSLVRIRELEPRLRLGWSVPRLRRDYSRPAWALPAYPGLLYLRRKLPGAARGHLEAGRCDALMVHHKLVTARLVRTVREQGGELYVWTVDDAARIRALEALGVTGVITNDPRLFAAAAGQRIVQVAAE
jgi:glycerophosphoryl diester phosphodiesterase